MIIYNHKTLIINLTYLLICWPSAKTKKSSTSGGAKKAICLLLKAQFCATFCFFGAGGHVSISGIRDFSDFGVQHPLSTEIEDGVAVDVGEVDVDDVEVTSLLILHGGDGFLKWLLFLLLVVVFFIGFFPFDAIFETKNKREEKRERERESKKKNGNGWMWIYIWRVFINLSGVLL